MDCCELNKQMGQVCVSRITMKPCKLRGRTAGSQGGLDNSKLCQKCQEGVQGKKRLWVKKPTQNRSTRSKKKTEWLKIKVSRITLRWAGRKV